MSLAYRDAVNPVPGAGDQLIQVINELLNGVVALVPTNRIKPDQSTCAGLLDLSGGLILERSDRSGQQS